MINIINRGSTPPPAPIYAGRVQLNSITRNYTSTAKATIDIKAQVPNYSSLQTSNFYLVFFKSVTNYTAGNNPNLSWNTPTLSYNNVTGVLEVSSVWSTGLNGTAGYIQLDVYVI